MKARFTFLGQLTPKIKHYFVEPQDLPFYFKPGQWIDVWAPVEGKNVSGYTIISPVTSTRGFELAIRESDFHPVTQYIHHQKEKNFELEISEARGKFFLTEDLYQRPLVFIAGGIGLTPILSMIRTVGAHHAQLFYSVSQVTDIMFPEEVRRLGVVTVTKDSPSSWAGDRGRISIEMLKKHNVNFESDFFICGPASMIDSIRTQLLQAQVPVDRIHHEKWW